MASNVVSIYLLTVNVKGSGTHATRFLNATLPDRWVPFCPQHIVEYRARKEVAVVRMTGLQQSSAFRDQPMMDERFQSLRHAVKIAP